MAKRNKNIQRNRIMNYFINATQSIIDEEGFDNVTLRKVADRAAYNSATLYNYFDNLDHLIYMTLIKYIRPYVDSLHKVLDPQLSSMQIYLITWKHFCHYAFRDPRCFRRLFVDEHDDSVKGSIKKYYEIFPDELEGLTSDILDMLMEENLFSRNKRMLESMWPEDKSDPILNTINNITVYSFQAILDNIISGADARPADEVSASMMDIVEAALRINEGRGKDQM